MTNAVNLASAAGTGFAFRNRIINGGFDVWQRATSHSAIGYGSADRWQVFTSSTSLTRSTDVPTGFIYSCLMTGTSVTNAQFSQRIEALNCADLVGQPITVSFWAKSTSGSSQLGVILHSANATDNFSGVTVINSQLYTLTSTWTRYSVTLTTSAPAAAANGVQVLFYRNGTESSTTFITGVQLEVGSVATPFERRPYGQELALCQRYFCKSSSLNVVPVNGAAYATAGMFFSSVAGAYLTTAAYTPFMKFPVTMRTEPATITIYNTNLPSPSTAGQWSIFSPSGGVWYNCSVSAQSVTQEGWAAALAGSWGSSGGLPLYGAWAASAEL